MIRTGNAVKASEGGQAVSGKYRLDPIKPAKSVYAQCDMKTESMVNLK